MSIRIKFSIDYSVSETPAVGKELGLAPPWYGTNDSMDDGGTYRRRITAGAMDVPVDINGLTTCKFLAIKSSQPISFKQNSTANTPTYLTPLGFGAQDAVLFMTTDQITELYFTNPGGLDAEVTLTIAGVI